MKTLKEQAREYLDKRMPLLAKHGDRSYVQGQIVGAIRMLEAVGIIDLKERAEMMDEYLDRAGV